MKVFPFWFFPWGIKEGIAPLPLEAVLDTVLKLKKKFKSSNRGALFHGGRKTMMGEGRYETKETDIHFVGLTISYQALIVKAICSLTRY